MNNEPYPLPGVDPGETTDLIVTPTGHSGLDLIPHSLQALEENLVLNDALPGLSLAEPTALLLDINNLFRRADDNDWRIDYQKLKYVFEQRCNLRYCAAFSAVDRQDFAGQRWADYMKKQGYVMHSKDLKRYVNSQNERVAKGNMDVEITVDAMDLSPGFGHVIIGSCDGDFVPLVNRLKKGYFRKVSVLGLSGENRTGISETLIQAADHFYDMSVFQNHIEYKKIARHDR